MSIVSTILAFLIAVLVLIAIHEWGHFIVARLFKVKVLRYSIGFGKPLFRWHGKSGTEYVFAWFPLGGYVKMLDETEQAVSEQDKPFAFNRKPVWVRFLIVAAGPVTNLVLAAVLFWMMFVVGLQQVKPVIGEVAPSSIAMQASVQPGEQIVAVDGEPTRSWQAVMIALVKRLGDQNNLLLSLEDPNGSTRQLSIPLATWQVDSLTPNPLRALGIRPYFPRVPAQIDQVQQGSPADEAGLQVGDRVLAINGEPVDDWVKLVEAIQTMPDEDIQLLIVRDGQEINYTVHTGVKYSNLFKKYGFLGVLAEPVPFPKEYELEQQYSPLAAIVPAIVETKDFFVFNGLMLGKLVTGKVSLQSLGGPITIFRTSDRAWQQGIPVYLSFLALVSVMLAFVNFLPVPGLDGGHLLFYVIEMLRRKPLSIAVQTLSLRIGLILLLVLMAHATINDVLRLAV